MSKWTGFYKVASPQSQSSLVTDNITDSIGAYGNYTWYRNIVSSSSKRITKYAEYDLMDADIEIARALDTIAEEMTGNADEEDLPIIIEMDDEESATIDNNLTLTIKTALKYWCDLHDWQNKLFDIARHLIKYGDCFFEKNPNNPNAPWVYVPAKFVYGAMIDPENQRNIMGWIVSNDPQKLQSTQTYMNPELIKTSDQIVRFTLNNDMSDLAPFGNSVLADIYKTFQQKELLESSIIIYRIQRAPERRVFYIDVGKMPPQRAKQYLEQMKNEIKSKKIPTLLNQNGGETLDSIYNPQSMVEDIFIAQRADGRGSKIESLPGGAQLGEITDLEYFQNKLWRGLRIPPSYMRTAQEGQSMYTDGKVGVAYILELRFSLYIQRMQAFLEKVLDDEFKRYLREKNIHIDSTSFKLKLPMPSNFGIYRRQELDSQLLNTFGTADNVPYLAKRFIMQRYLNLTDEEIALNDKMRREEMNLNPNGGEKDMMKVYNPQAASEMDQMGMGEEIGFDEPDLSMPSSSSPTAPAPSGMGGGPTGTGAASGGGAAGGKGGAPASGGAAPAGTGGQI